MGARDHGEGRGGEGEGTYETLVIGEVGREKEVSSTSHEDPKDARNSINVCESASVAKRGARPDGDQHLAPPILMLEFSAWIMPGMLGPMATTRATRARQLIPNVSALFLEVSSGSRNGVKEKRTVVDPTRVVQLDNVVLLPLDEEVIGCEDRSDGSEDDRIGSHERDLSSLASAPRTR